MEQLDHLTTCVVTKEHRWEGVANAEAALLSARGHKEREAGKPAEELPSLEQLRRGSLSPCGSARDQPQLAGCTQPYSPPLSSRTHGVRPLSAGSSNSRSAANAADSENSELVWPSGAGSAAARARPSSAGSGTPSRARPGSAGALGRPAITTGVASPEYGESSFPFLESFQEEGCNVNVDKDGPELSSTCATSLGGNVSEAPTSPSLADATSPTSLASPSFGGLGSGGLAGPILEDVDGEGQHPVSGDVEGEEESRRIGVRHATLRTLVAGPLPSCSLAAHSPG